MSARMRVRSHHRRHLHQLLQTETLVRFPTKGSGADRQHRQRLHGCCRYCDLDQISEVGISIKIGPVLVQESPAPILDPHPPTPLRGWRRHFPNQLCLHELGAQSCKFGVADRSCLLKPFELFNFICGAETNHAPKLITRLLSLLHIALCHASTLKDQICKDGKVWNDDQCYYPDGLDPTRNVVATEQIGKNSNQ